MKIKTIKIEEFFLRDTLQIEMNRTELEMLIVLLDELKECIKDEESVRWATVMLQEIDKAMKKR